MNITFVGWRGDILRHEHQVTPLYSASFDVPGEASNEAIAWSRRLTASGKINDVNLHGDYLMTIHLAPAELRGSMEAYIQADAGAALEMLAELVARARRAADQQSADGEPDE
ncbi:MAG: hypothetical protein LBQ06_04355 [Frankiaceae bacterium]|nr:hypothetical protein [Frankiaceae bacterium]